MYAIVLGLVGNAVSFAAGVRHRFGGGFRTAIEHLPAIEAARRAYGAASWPDGDPR